MRIDEYGDIIFEFGDIVTRTGIDEHLVYTNAGEDGWGNIDIVCIKEPVPLFEGDDPWIKLGETESNLARRYSFLRESLNPIELLANKGINIKELE